MATVAVSCPSCRHSDVIKAGKQPNGTQRYRCQNLACKRTIFQLVYVAQGRLPETQRLIVEMTLNGSGIRDTARVLQVSLVTVLSTVRRNYAASCNGGGAVNVASSVVLVYVHRIGLG